MARETQEEIEMDTQGGEVPKESDSVHPSTLKLYETQFFGFTPQTCMLRVYSAFQDCLYDILPVVEMVCVRQLSRGGPDGSDEQLRTRARECSRKLQQFLDERFKQLSTRMEALLLDRCLTVPSNVLLPEDQSHKTYHQHIQEVLRLESSHADLQSAYEAEVCARQALLAELEEQKEVQKQLDGVLTWVKELQAAWVKEGNGSFQESFRLVMESVKRLQEAVKELQAQDH
ncbi:protein MIS12 homolog isoform X2 [Notolabrus celidotus]|uniref:protein MIS12 homolog isoform X2 n=1 Tax=Notolabrus celidotus TaxID=1203425 RepID=UPI0014906CDF|nr:protein MIS12 homolog isoform X2 [Notolabrus celidotus]